MSEYHVDQKCCQGNVSFSLCSF